MAPEMNDELKNAMQCSEFEALLTDALDGTLTLASRERFEQHRSGCAVCSVAFAEAEAGKSWLAALDVVEPPRMLVHNIIAVTTGAQRTEAAAAAQGAGWMDRLRARLRPGFRGMMQPRFAMSMAMGFFSLSMVFNLAGIHPTHITADDLRPSNVANRTLSSLAETQGRIVKYYESMRFVYEIESRVRELRSAGEQAPTDQQKKKEQEKRNPNEKTSERPGKNKNDRDRYAWELLNNTWAMVASPTMAVPEEAK